MRDYRKIQAWQLADDLTAAIYEATKQFPKEELYTPTNTSICRDSPQSVFQESLCSREPARGSVESALFSVCREQARSTTISVSKRLSQHALTQRKPKRQPASWPA
jgi:hypothetical protein